MSSGNISPTSSITNKLVKALWSLCIVVVLCCINIDSAKAGV